MDNKRLNTRAQRDVELDAELAELEKEFVAEHNKPEAPEPEVRSVEDESWKKRYSDLRSHTAKKENEFSRKEQEFANRITALEKQLSEAANTEGLPKRADAASIREWMAEFPDVASIVLGIVEERQEVRDQKFNQKLEALEADRTQLAQEKALQRVINAHKDFPTLVRSDEFQAWIADHANKAEKGNRFSTAIVEALWGDDYDADAAIEAVSLYKREASAPKRTPKDEQADAVASVRGSNTREPATSGNKPMFKESQIEKMSHREYDKHEKDIEEARLDGRIIYDLSGAAR